jgi:hypothetical protein
MAAINFGKSEQQKNTDKAMEILQKWSGPIYEQAAKRGFGSTKKTHDPSITAKMMADIPSATESLLGGIQGALAGYQAGGSFAGAMKPGDNKMATIGKMAGAALGGYTGASAYGSSRQAGIGVGASLGAVAEHASQWEQITKQKLAQDAISTMGQRMAVLNNPKNPEQAIQFSAEKDQLVAQTAQQLYSAGVAPDKAIILSESIASIHDPSGRYSPIGVRANAALMKYQASPQGQADKDELSYMMKALVMEKRVSEGELPFNMGQMAVGAGKAARAAQQQAGPPMGPEEVAGPGAGPQIPDALNPNAPQQGGLVDDIVPQLGPGGGAAPQQTINNQGGIVGKIKAGAKWMDDLLPGPLAMMGGGKKKAGIVSPDLVERDTAATNALAGGIQKMQQIGAGDVASVDLLRSTATANAAIDAMIERVASGDMPHGMLENFGQSVHDKGISGQAVGAGVGAVAGGIGGGIIGSAGTPIGTMIGGKVGAGMGATAGATIGSKIAGDTRLFQGKSPFLSDEEMAVLNEIQVMSADIKPAWARAGDPGNRVTDSESKMIEQLLPDPAFSPEENIRKLITLKERLAERAENNAMALQAMQQGKMNTQTMGAQQDWNMWVQQQQYKAQEAMQRKQNNGNGGIYFFE